MNDIMNGAVANVAMGLAVKHTVSQDVDLRPQKTRNPTSQARDTYSDTHDLMVRDS